MHENHSRGLYAEELIGRALLAAREIAPGSWETRVALPGRKSPDDGTLGRSDILVAPAWIAAEIVAGANREPERYLLDTLSQWEKTWAPDERRRLTRALRIDHQGRCWLREPRAAVREPSSWDAIGRTMPSLINGAGAYGPLQFRPTGAEKGIFEIPPWPGNPNTARLRQLGALYDAINEWHHRLAGGREQPKATQHN